VPRAARLGFGLLGLGWAALAVAAAGIVETPTAWCSDFPEPSGQLDLHVGLAVAGIAVALSFVPALVIPAFLSERLWQWPTPWLTAVWIATAGALISVDMLARHFLGIGGSGGACG
jgi:hypothetical protein